jgi:hypothetical protein
MPEETGGVTLEAKRSAPAWSVTRYARSDCSRFTRRSISASFFAPRTAP